MTLLLVSTGIQGLALIYKINPRYLTGLLLISRSLSQGPFPRFGLAQGQVDRPELLVWRSRQPHRPHGATRKSPSQKKEQRALQNGVPLCSQHGTGTLNSFYIEYLNNGHPNSKPLWGFCFQKHLTLERAINRQSPIFVLLTKNTF